MSLVQVPAFAAELEGGETPSVSEPAAPEANETTSPVDKAPADNGAAPAPEAPKQDATEEKEETTPVETPEEETNQETKEEPAETETPEADAEEGTAQEETNEETNSEEPNDEDATDNETPEEDAEAEDAEEETPEDTTESETPEEETEEDADKEEITDEEEVLDEEPTEEVTYSEAAQKFLDAVAGLPDSVTKENFESISALLDKVQALFGALTEEEMALVDPVLVKVSNLMESLDEMGALLEEDESKAEVSTYDDLVKAIENVKVTEITLAKDFDTKTFQPLNIVGRAGQLILNLGNHVLSAGTADTAAITVGDGANPLQLTLNGGTITNSAGNGVFVKNGSTLTTNGVTITENGNNGVTLAGGANFVMNKGTTISKNHSSGVYVGGNATFTMNDGEISNNTVEKNNATEVFKLQNVLQTIWYRAGGGVYVNGGTFNMTGGTITKNSTGDLETKAVIDGTKTERDDYVGRGGGVAVMNGGTFNLSGNATISDNKAGEAGGVMIGQTTKKSDKNESNNADSVFTMTGGTVDGNVAYKGEGGGIYIKGEGHISAGQITNNTTNTTTELGGGGIYVENSGTLDLVNAIITANTAANFGGGIAACVHGKTLMFSTNGAGIFENVANGDGSKTGNTKVDGSGAWSQFDVKELAAGAMDIFSAGNSSVKDWTTDQTGTPGALIGLIMLGGEMANWAGWKINFDSYTDTSGAKFTEVKDPTAAIHGDQLLGLTSNASDKAIAAAWAAANAATGGGVLISGNYSAMDGGGIANNGILTIGATDSEETENAPELDLSKTLENVEDREEATSLQEGEFSFNLVDDEGNTVETMTNTANGKWTYDFKGYSEKFNTAEDGTTFKFTVSEDQSDKADNIDYDLTTYEVTIKVSVKEISADVGGNVYTVITRLLTPTIVKVTDKNGAPVNETVSVLDFVNTYTAPETDNPPDEEKPPVDPVDPPEKPPVDPPEKPEEKPPVEETPEEPPVDVPDEEPPLVEIPEEPPVDIPDEEPPLVEIPDEQPPLVEIPEPDVPRAPATPVVEVPDPEVPLVDIPEEDVPLADVPATGDNSGLWMVLGLVACAGLAYFFLDEKKRQNEAK
ncbi:MAG: hypothetical protein HFE98_08575 [Ruminiclostridium sp.]|nr:hypothetical protein [Ruminiclostridium sp.]